MAARQVELPKGLFFLVDEEDFERVNQYLWHLKRKGKWHYVTTGRANLTVHRLIMGCEPGNGKLVDHRNGDTLNNQRYNLRVTDHRGNATNVTNSKRQKAGGYKGVTWNPRAKKWEANICAGEIQANGKRRKMYLGVFVDPVVAAHVYDAAAIKYFGEFASLNFPIATEGTALNG